MALVTGGSRGIGLAIARALVADGVQVAITGRSDAHLSAARPTIESGGPGAVETLQADVRRYDDVERAIDADGRALRRPRHPRSTTPASASSPTSPT